MLRIRSFAGLRPRADVASRVASVPYDVVTTAEARELAKDNPHSFLRVTRAEIQLPDDCSPYSDIVYEKAASTFREMQREGVFIRDAAAHIYLYRQQMTVLGRRVSQTGVVGACHIDDYMQGIIRTHEKTRKVKEDDRTRHVLAINANAGPVFLMYKEQPRLSELMEQDQTQEPLNDFTSVDEVRHTVWRVPKPEEYVRCFAGVEAAYVADGHHRAAAAVRAGAKKRTEGETASEEYNWFLAALFRTKDLTILPYHRVVKDLNGVSPSAYLERLRRVARIELCERPEPANPLRFAMYIERHWYHVTLDAAGVDLGDPLASLHYALLSDKILGPTLGIGDLRTDERIDFVGGIAGYGELERRVDQGAAAVAFAMDATGVEQITAVADVGQLMPPKSTWFEPKLRSGLVIHVLD